MIDKISAFLTSLKQGSEESIEESITIELACTVLLCEVMRADGLINNQERQHLSQLVSQKFLCNSNTADALIEEAIELCEQANDFHRFTSIVNRHYQPEEKIKIIALLWQLALADDHLAAIEEHTIRRIADLLHLRHSEYITAKSSVIAKP
ncbi:TerB family tellurite resistance protein [Thalassotalea sediminis]|uniref:tellurite resistance TerB family protein n=1 Tax=Thalassotalea sediminis TaxID=1759089 RepID=UPI0025746091|nr:TerB family tellurite resistance protein [Thalassotalea sediminis]